MLLWQTCRCTMWIVAILASVKVYAGSYGALGIHSWMLADYNPPPRSAVTRPDSPDLVRPTRPMLSPMTPGMISHRLIERYADMLIDAEMDEEVIADALADYRASYRSLDWEPLYELGKRAAELSMDHNAAAEYLDTYRAWHEVRTTYLKRIEELDRQFFSALDAWVELPEQITILERFRRDRQRERCMVMAAIGVGVNVDVAAIVKHVLSEDDIELTENEARAVELRLDEYQQRHVTVMCELNRALDSLIMENTVRQATISPTGQDDVQDAATAVETALRAKQRVSAASASIWRMNRQAVESIAELMPARSAWKVRTRYWQAAGDRSCFPDPGDLTPLFHAIDELHDMGDEQARLFDLIRMEYTEESVSLSYRILESHLKYTDRAYAPSTLTADHETELRPVQLLLERRHALSSQTLELISDILTDSQRSELGDVIKVIEENLTRVPRPRTLGPAFR